MKAQSLHRVENIVTTGEIAHHEQFLLLPHYFQKLCARRSVERVCLWQGAKTIQPHLTKRKGALAQLIIGNDSCM